MVVAVTIAVWTLAVAGVAWGQEAQTSPTPNPTPDDKSDEEATGPSDISRARFCWRRPGSGE